MSISVEEIPIWSSSKGSGSICTTVVGSFGYLYVQCFSGRRSLGETSVVSFFSQSVKRQIRYLNLSERLREWSLIMGRGGATKLENRGSYTFCAPPQDKVNLFTPPPPFFKW